MARKQHFSMLHHAVLEWGEMQAGLVFTSPRCFPRQMAVGRMIETLAGDIAWLR